MINVTSGKHSFYYFITTIIVRILSVSWKNVEVNHYADFIILNVRL